VIHEGEHYIWPHIAYDPSYSEQDPWVPSDTKLDVPHPFCFQLGLKEITWTVRQDRYIRPTTAQRASQANQLPFSSPADQV
jgi:hypothetical protein